MLSATSSSLGNDADNHAKQSTSPAVSTSYSCTSCQITFENGQQQRIHMKEPWHINNIQRRIASLPPIPLDAFNEQNAQNEQIEKSIDASETLVRRIKPAKRHNSYNSSSDEYISDQEDRQDASPFQCLFCSQDFGNDDEGFAANLDHMHTAHGMLVPDRESVTDLQSFVGYLATEVRVWHECLYCGATKPSISSIQSHMKDKGHCLLNFDREPELLDFWESAELLDEDNTPTLEREHPINMSGTEIRLASGRIISSKNAASTTKRASRRQDLSASTMRALPQDSEEADSQPVDVMPQLASGRQLARSDQMGIVGISMQQRQALALAEKKAQRSEAVARRAREWVYAKGANSQKFDQLDNQHKWGKQQHKLLPR